jgi:hypothetical protein
VQLQLAGVFTDPQFEVLTKTREWWLSSPLADTIRTDPARKVIVLKQWFGGWNWQLRRWPETDGIKAVPLDGPRVVAELERALTLAGRLAQRVPGLQRGHRHSGALFSLLMALPPTVSGEAAAGEILGVLGEARLPFDDYYFDTIVCQ